MKPNVVVKFADPYPGPHSSSTEIETFNMPSRDILELCRLYLGPPVKPDATWNCGTDVVWPVLDIKNSPVAIDAINRYVCRHQILAGD